jgi:hypothetical protein
MKLLQLLATLLASTLLVLGQSVQSVAYDEVYDEASRSLNTVACSGAGGGPLARYPTLGAVPSFPRVGGAFAVSGYGSPECGTCWSLTYAPRGGAPTRTVLVVLVDSASAGFAISRAAMDILTGGLAVQLGRVNALAVKVPSRLCGL